MSDVTQLFRDHEKWLHTLAFNNHGRLVKVGYNIELEELFSIFCELFMVAINTHNPEKGKLTTYLHSVCHNHVTGMIEKFFSRGECNARTESEYFRPANETEDPFSLDSFSMDGAENILGDYEIMEALKEKAKDLSPFAKILLEYTLNPPDFIEREIMAHEAKHAMSLEMDNVPFTHRRKTLTLNFVAKFLERTAESPKARKFVRSAVSEIKTAVYEVVA